MRVDFDWSARLTAMSLMDRGEYTVSQAAVVLGVSERQVWRIRAAYREEGAAGLIHGNRGREANRRCSSEVRRQVVELAGSEQYRGCNQVHLTELLAKREGIELARSTVRRILAEVGIESPRRRKRRRHHRRRRERSPEQGMLLQMDGSSHDWLEGRGPRLCLLAGIDDATGEVHGAAFGCT
jgi:transposase